VFVVVFAACSRLLDTRAVRSPSSVSS
jgi:hypothetical protein